MQDAGNQNARYRLSIKDYMPPMFHASQSVTDVVASAANRGIIGEPTAACFQTVEVSNSLLFSPRLKRVGSDGQQVGFRAPGEPS